MRLEIISPSVGGISHSPLVWPGLPFKLETQRDRASYTSDANTIRKLQDTIVMLEIVLHSRNGS